MATRTRRCAADTAAADPVPSPAAGAPHWQVPRLASPGQVFEETDIRNVTTRVVADARGVVIPRSTAEVQLVDRLPVAPAAILAAPVPDAIPNEPTDDADPDAGEED